jgi:hypothetical protein
MTASRYLSGHLWQRLGASILLLAAFALSVAAQQPAPSSPSSPVSIVRQATETELHSDPQAHLFAWKERKIESTGTRVQNLVETPAGVLTRVVLINDKPLDEKQRKAEAERVRKMLEPAQLARKKKETAEDDERTRKMLASIPDAFDFALLDSRVALNGHKIAHLKFTARPGYNPPNREAMVFTGMQGEIFVDEDAHRLVKIDGVLFKEVNFGWGILGRLYKGGRFFVEQSEVAPGHWDTTHMILHFDGKVLLVKPLHIEDDSSSWDYRPVPPMSSEQAMDYLSRDPSAQHAQLQH